MKITNNLNLPKPFVSAVERNYQYKDKQYSTTQMLKGVREIMLTRRHFDEMEQDVSDSIWLILGTAMHKVLEDSQEAIDELKETKVVIDMPNGYKLSGIQDLYTESTKRITDYKTGSVWKVIKDDFEDYRKQTLIYAYMFRKIGFEVDNAEIVMVLKDFSKTKAKTESNYPKYPVFIKHFDFTDKDFEEIEKFLIHKFQEIENAETLKDDFLPMCTDKERWAEPTRYAVMQKGKKRALKLFDTDLEALEYAEQVGGYVEKREGTDKKCEEYCQCCEFCSYWKEHYGK